MTPATKVQIQSFSQCGLESISTRIIQNILAKMLISEPLPDFLNHNRWEHFKNNPGGLTCTKFWTHGACGCYLLIFTGCRSSFSCADPLEGRLRERREYRVSLQNSLASPCLLEIQTGILTDTVMISGIWFKIIRVTSEK